MMGAEVVKPRLLSVAFAVMVWVPLVEVQVNGKLGEVVDSPSFVLPEKYSTLMTEPSESETVEVKLTAAGAV